MKQWCCCLLLIILTGTAFAQVRNLDSTDWKNAKWIAYQNIPDSGIIVPHVHLNGKKSWGPRKDVLPLFRKEFKVTKSLKAATAFISGLGQYELSINGAKTGDNFLEPGWTDYRRAAQYVTYDVTNRIKPGSNAIGVMLGNGFYYIPGERYRKMTGAYGYPKMILRLQLQYADGTTEDIVSDESWQTAPSPIYFSSIYGGEDYDAQREQEGWNKPGFKAAAWKSALLTTPVPLIAQINPPVRKTHRYEVATSWQLHDTTVYDFGQNTAAVPAIQVWGNAGDTIRLFPGELVNKDGTVNQKATGAPYILTYVLKGSTAAAPESWQPRFTYYGQRYIQVVRIPAHTRISKPEVVKIFNDAISAAGARIGSFSCSSDLFNNIFRLIDHAITSNTVSVFTDCPHREKLGWLEQTYLMGPSVSYNYNILPHYRKAIFDMKQAQYPDGKIPEIVPEFTHFTPPFDESPEWGSAAIIVPWNNYRWYGDLTTLTDSYGMMKRYVAYLDSRSTGNIVSHGLGDWFDIGPQRPGISQMTKMGITATATYYYDLTIMARVARVLGKKSDAAKYGKLAAKVKSAFNKSYFDAQHQQYDSASQTANAMALYMNLVPQASRKAVLHALVTDIHTRNNALTAGDIGYRYVLQALQQGDSNEVIFDMNSRDDVPGYGYQIRHGATALTESWQAYEFVSNNHFMLGHLMEWFYAGLAGIGQSESSMGFRDIVIKPSPVGDIKWVKCSYGSAAGNILVEWKKENNIFELKVVIPENAVATICMPATAGARITQNGAALSTVSIKNNRTAIAVSAGKYFFTVTE
ncbi:Alpha-L-rhamnosidase N-terminal domain-containing protein [Chitinophaga jiangningensis]|uniref:alpha-L-rhamnosidase n=1 Tax=Chitinophaga jiangningensis TaxID=1419482 RepID=A0A1M7ACJ5_9BACT|nr:family 78 glycoside hydrolase catalytic domain [Chitinophaga jiangningensis]SHL40345.1 Alpha-L-rhamnosidase N-terminal domain-containing protein [Chitinophaga jiangningensis]